MKFNFLDFIFLVGVALIMFPIIVYSWMLGSFISGLVLLYLSITANKYKSANKEKKGGG